MLLKKQPSHLTLQKVFTRSLNAGVSSAPGNERIKGSAGRDPAKQTTRSFRGKLASAHSPSDMLNEYVAHKGKTGPYECGVPNKVVRMPRDKCGVGSRRPGRTVLVGPSAGPTATAASLHLHHRAAGCAEAGAPQDCPLGKASRPRAGPAGALPPAAPPQRSGEVSGQQGSLACRGGLSRTSFLPLNL